MTTLEDLYYGNIEPCDSETLLRNPRYKESVAMVDELQQAISSTMSGAEEKLLERYLAASNELSSVIAEDAFKTGFGIAVKIMMEVLE